MHQSVLFGVLVYFVVALALTAALCLPGVRQRMVQWAQRFWSSSRQAQRQALQASQRSAAMARTGLAGAAKGGQGWLARHFWALLTALVVLVGLPGGALLLRQELPPDTFDHTAVRPSDSRVAALLQGEQLVAPAALPPELFMVRELEIRRPLIRFASREWALLDAEFRQRLLVVFQIMRERHGYELVLLEGYRSPERQASLAAAGPQVTRAGAYESYHQFGLAADVAFLREGRIVISELDPWAMQGYELYGELAQSLGLTWGGSWRSLKDFGHVELRRPGVLGRSPDRTEAPAAAVH